ncbi:L-serine dehydratase/L-threonine deaminase-like [Bradysia coprophila]|uniref:L-serine dehydratase/L-threonine deaminase-like n=1 Tax=Bradysia coprophila TaxID=38358 RepID=UPI00187DA93E|nr:L-serine dehydratase/L-threonine deaminase-like [Bradysia coprophila]
MQNQVLSIESPLQHSIPLSKCISHDVFLKLENVQPTNSFKIRGMTRMCSKRRDAGYKKFISFSGGNAGISLAYVASQMNIPCHIIVPSFVSERITNRMKSLGAVVETAPDSRQAQLEAIRLADSSPNIL